MCISFTFISQLLIDQVALVNLIITPMYSGLVAGLNVCKTDISHQQDKNGKKENRG